MRKWAFLTTATAALVIGCAGSGGVAGGGGGGGGVLRARVNDAELDRPGLITTTYISGQGRGTGTISAVFRFVTFTPDPNTPPNERVETTLNPELLVGLDAYTHNSVALNSATLGGDDGRDFDTFQLNVQKIRIAAPGSNPPFFEFTNPTFPNAPILTADFDLRLRTMSGRHSSVPIFLDDAMLNHDGTALMFDRGLFELVNYDITQNRILAFFSDYVSFDLTAMAAGSRPNLISVEGAGATADTVYFSGDAIAMSAVVGGVRVFEVLTPLGNIAGKWSPPVSSGPITTPFGTYTLLEVDPRVLPVPNAARIVSLAGIWRPYDLMFLDLGAFEMFAIPNSEDRDDQDIVMVQRNGAGRIVNMYFGYADLSSGDFSVFPIDQVDNGAVGNELVGVVDGLLNKTGGPAASPQDVRTGVFTFASSPLPSGFPSTGPFVVMRK